MTVEARRIKVTGLVQGVGFRPFVWRLAQELGVLGWVRNGVDGVEIFAQAEASALELFQSRLIADAPILARIDLLDPRACVPESWDGFSIASTVHGISSTAIGPDTAVCALCLQELFDPIARRYGHAFITCTHCGPRYTVTRALPYDRPQTSMAGFALCPACQSEYDSPADRRFHAETTCCPDCGPTLILRDPLGVEIPGDPIATALQMLRLGKVVAIKGLGGFHLACDARNARAVAGLRARKNRDAKPFAVMLANASSLAPYAKVTEPERWALECRERPIVLLEAHATAGHTLAGVAPGLQCLGVMLPTTPIQFLLFHEAAGRPPGIAWLNTAQDMVLVMTSANPGGEPIIRDARAEAQRLQGIADAVLDHDREVLARCDDSVVRVHGGQTQFIRRSRGYVPSASALKISGPSVLAFGAYFKNCICVTRDREAFVSTHVGDLDTAAACSYLDETVQRMVQLLEVEPAIVVHDLHPDFYSTRAAFEFAQRHSLPRIAVQHHHAHIAAVCAEHGQLGACLGLALDGVGLGSDGHAWGGELLLVDGARCQRLGHLRPMAMPGGDVAAREPWRMAGSVLHASGRSPLTGSRCLQPGSPMLASLLERQVRCPLTSSMGRVFDAAASLLGLCHFAQFEAQAAILLEQAAGAYVRRCGWPAPWDDTWTLSDQGQLDLLGLLLRLDTVDDPQWGAAVFHATLVSALTGWVVRMAVPVACTTVVFGGGCFLNAWLALHLRQNLQNAGFTVLASKNFSPGDASIALGQAWIALNSLET